VADDGTVFGLDSDYATLHKDGKDDSDRFQLHLTNIIVSWMEAPAAARVVTDILDRLPDAFSVDVYRDKVEKVYQHVYDSYFGRVAACTQLPDTVSNPWDLRTHERTLEVCSEVCRPGRNAWTVPGVPLTPSLVARVYKNSPSITDLSRV
jgi:hypothetical protein